MKIAFFDAHPFERPVFENANAGYGHEFTFMATRLDPQTAVMAKGFDVVCAFANDDLGSATLTKLKEVGVSLIALRSAGYNHVDLTTANRLKLPVVRVPAYSPYSVAEHAVAMLLTFNRKTHRAHQRVRELNFSLDGLVGFDLHGKTVGVVGTGRIGAAFARIMNGFGCRVLGYDLRPDPDLVANKIVEYVPLERLYEESLIISLHVPLIKDTHHLIDAKALGQMKKGVILINTGRGRLIDTAALIKSLKSGHIGGACLDVYEEEENVFFHDYSDQLLQDDVLARLLTFPNVLVTAHQGFLTQEALNNIASTTLENIQAFTQGKKLENAVTDF